MLVSVVRQVTTTTSTASKACNTQKQQKWLHWQIERTKTQVKRNEKQCKNNANNVGYNIPPPSLKRKVTLQHSSTLTITLQLTHSSITLHVEIVRECSRMFEIVRDCSRMFEIVRDCSRLFGNTSEPGASVVESTTLVPSLTTRTHSHVHNSNHQLVDKVTKCCPMQTSNTYTRTNYDSSVLSCRW